MTLMSVCCSKSEYWVFEMSNLILLTGISSSKDNVSEEAKEKVDRKLVKIGMAVHEDSDFGWTGGSVWLVPTDGDVTDWQPIARRS